MRNGQRKPIHRALGLHLHLGLAQAPSLLRRGLLNLYNVVQYDIRHDLTLYIL